MIAWAIATAGLAAAGSAFVFKGDDGAHAVVLSTHGEGHETPTETPETAPAATVDPAEFRRAPPPPDGRPRVAVIVRGLGLSLALTTDAVSKLPPDISLGLSVYARGLQKQLDSARGAGHEVFLDVPVEPSGFPNNDAGPKALLTSLGAAENAERLEWSLARATGYPGIVFAPASPALDSRETMAPLLAEPAAHGLIWLSPRSRGLEGASVIQASADLIIDTAATPHDIDLALERLEATARSKGSALAIANAYPVTIAELAAWSAALEAHGIQLVPASALSVTPAS